MFSESRQALYTIFNLQLFERHGEGKVTLSEDQITRVLESVDKFFNGAGVQPAGF